MLSLVFYLFGVGLGCSLAMAASGSISGQLTDPHGDVVALGHVSLSRQGEATAIRTVDTDASGRFTIADVGPGAYSLTAAVDGFRPLTRDVSITAGKTAVTDLRLTEFSVQLESITVNAGTLEPSLDIAQCGDFPQNAAVAR